MKKVLSIIAVFALLIVVATVAFAADDQCQLYLDLKSEENLLRATYEMDIYLDDDYLGSVENGKYFTIKLDVSSGSHTLEACKADDNSISGTKKFKISGDMTLRSTISHSKSSIEFKEYKTFDSIIGAELEVPYVIDMTLSEALNEMKDIGFVNIRPEPYGSIWDYNNWLVVEQSEDMGEILDKNYFIELDCIKLDEYFENRYVGMTLNEVQKDAEENNFALKYENTKEKSDFASFVKTLDEDEKEEWIVDKAKQYTSAKRTALLTLVSKDDYDGSGPSTKKDDSKNDAPKDSKPKESKPTPEPVKPISVTAPALYNAFSDNEISANQTYKGKIVDVSGVVDSISSQLGSYYVSLRADDWGITTVECKFSKSHEDELAKLRSGDRVVIRGNCDGLTFVYVYISNCEVVG